MMCFLGADLRQLSREARQYTHLATSLTLFYFVFVGFVIGVGVGGSGFFWFFKKGFLCIIALAVLELIM